MPNAGDKRQRRALRPAVLVVAAITATLAGAAPAPAATVFADVEYSRGEGGSFGPVRFTAARGEANRLTVTSERPSRAFRRGSFLFVDTRVTLRARGDCRRLGRHRVRCPYTELRARIDLRDRGDRARIVGVGPGASGLDVKAGSGNDVVRGSSSFDRIWASTGRDRIYARGGEDWLYDGESERTRARDLFNGGTHEQRTNPDVVSYESRRRKVTVKLAAGRAGPERDTLAAVEAARGGSGNDVLLGDARDNRLFGGAGDDTVRGGDGTDVADGGAGSDYVNGGDGDDFVFGDFNTRASRSGDDVLRGGPGIDRVKGNEGDDRILIRGRSADDADCGAGDDVAEVDAQDTVRHCESVSGRV